MNEAIDAHRNDFPIKGFHHVEFWVANAYQSAHYYRAIHGYEIVGYRGPETGVTETASYALAQGDVRLVFTSALHPDHPISDHVRLHGPGVRDVAIHVPDAAKALELATTRGAIESLPLTTVQGEHGGWSFAAIEAYGEAGLKDRAPELMKIAQKNKDLMMRVAAVTALGQLDVDEAGPLSHADDAQHRVHVVDVAHRAAHGSCLRDCLCQRTAGQGVPAGAHRAVAVATDASVGTLDLYGCRHGTQHDGVDIGVEARQSDVIGDGSRPHPAQPCGRIVLCRRSGVGSCGARS